MARRRQVPRDENEPSYGKIMTRQLIPRDARSNPRRVLSGIAFLVFIGFFLIASFGRGCQQAPPSETPTSQPPSSHISLD
ncbi:hypothetical protein [Pseudodesulfovibrio sp.]|uniref:hypothetical protein n=1 Tax=unclassified Pseudodesulfovibrio TaxID=2661612 RepID=UPI003AFFDF00